MKILAIHALRPNAQWSLKGDELEWLDTEQSEPTEAEITAKIAELEADYTAKQYQRDRAEAYPSIADQLDQIYHEGIDAWKETIAAVKAEYPKS
jgi:uncharacterized membrane-anchored protein